MTKKFTVLLLGAAVTLVGAVPAFAQDGRLTQESVKALYNKGIQMRDSSAEDYVKYLEENMMDDIKIVLDVEMQTDGVKGPRQTQTLNKRGMIESSKGGFNPNNQYDQEIISITISPDGQTATIKDETDAKIFAELPGPSGQINLQMDQNVLCEIKMVNSGGGQPKLSDTACNIDTEVVGDATANQIMKSQLQQAR